MRYTLAVLIEQLATAENAYRRTCKNMSTDECVVGSYNQHEIVKAYDKVVDIRAGLALVKQEIADNE